ncbi:pilus assembly protein [Stenotrophomonas sp. MYb238]|uniref:TadE/TadG family type IV pilus assembly protein n=1 Tax=Stenotrophomonas sp. MYb238 TaxID=2040281 RepID=UPI0012928615|nr:TadE/TadG family type IV pilus assembly protein [Stenotrophomonas sp. MYb238]MQP76119.1 pilus assembly protein [Stenotrophomonas sp. MYb238]
MDKQIRHRPNIKRQRGAVSIEYALLLMLGILPLLLVTFTGVMVFAAQQSLTLAASEGARAALRYGDVPARRNSACQASARSMQWLLNFSGEAPNCPAAAAAPIVVSDAYPCASDGTTRCMQVSVSYDYDRHPFIPGTGRLLGWTLGERMRSSAIVQLDNGN